MHKEHFGQTPTITPFPINEDMLSHIRPMERDDIEQVAKQHCSAMGHSLWAQLGRPFLQALYASLLQDPLFVAYVYVEDKEVQGFVAGSLDVPRTFSKLWREHWRQLLMPALTGVIHSPQLIGSLISTPFYFQRSAPSQRAKLVKAESLFCSFKPKLRGTRAAGHINLVLFKHFLKVGCRYIKITTETDNEASLRQLSHWGFAIEERFNFYGKDMYTLIMDLSTNPRLHDNKKL